MRAIVVVAHGSRVLSANEELNQVYDYLKQELRCEIFTMGYLELAEPSIPDSILEAIHRGATEIVVVPYFLLFGNHLQEDLPEIVQELQSQYPDVILRLAGPIGYHPKMADLLIDRLNEIRSM